LTPNCAKPNLFKIAFLIPELAMCTDASLAMVKAAPARPTLPRFGMQTLAAAALTLVLGAGPAFADWQADADEYAGSAWTEDTTGAATLGLHCDYFDSVVSVHIMTDRAWDARLTQPVSARVVIDGSAEGRDFPVSLWEFSGRVGARSVGTPVSSATGEGAATNERNIELIQAIFGASQSIDVSILGSTYTFPATGAVIAIYYALSPC
jgi:hypothetical protein